MSRHFDIIIAGAGASGLTAGIRAARLGAKVLILEHIDKPGKKILATGNGKCNFTNAKQGLAYYRGKDPAFVLPVFAQFGLTETLEFFEELGVYPQSKRDGYYYPYSGQAASVVEVLLMECRHLKIKIAYNVGIRSIQKEDNRFIFDTKQGIFTSLKCIIATGGRSAKKTGSDGSGIPYIAGFGHNVVDMVPALVQLQGKQSFLKEIAGIRAENKVSLYIENDMLSEDTGELQLTEFGVSGIPVFQVSRYASYGLLEGKAVYVLLNFLPHLSKEEVLKMIIRRFQPMWADRAVLEGKKTASAILKCNTDNGKTAEQALTGLLPDKLNRVFLAEAHIENSKPARACTKNELKTLAYLIQHLRVDIIGTKGFDAAQVTAGGADTTQINPESMESRLVPGLYFAGEVVDIDGMCGGYNLQWAWSSGWVAGEHAARELSC